MDSARSPVFVAAMAELPPPIPSAPLWLGLTALVPLIGAALIMLSPEPATAHAALVGFAIYAAVMLSFLGGVRWGLEIARAPDAIRGYEEVKQRSVAIAERQVAEWLEQFTRSGSQVAALQ